MDHYATQTGQSSIPGPSQDEHRLQPHPQPQPQPQWAEIVPFDMYAHPSQYAPPGPAPTAYGMENTEFNAGMAQYEQPPLMLDMMGHTAVPPQFAPYFPQSQMSPEPSYDPSIPPPFEPYFSQSQMALEPSYDPSTPPPFENYLAQLERIAGPSHRPSSPLPFGVYLPQPQTTAGTSYGMENTVFNAGMAQYEQPPLMLDMMGPTAVPPSFAPYFPQSQMVPEPSYDPSTPPPFEDYLPQLERIAGPSHRPSSPLPFGVYLPQPQTAAETSYGHPIPPPQYYDGYAQGPLAMGVALSDYPSAPSTVQSLDDQHLEHGLLQEARVGKRKAVDSDDAGRKTRTKRPRISHDIPPDFQRVVKHGKVLYKCTLPQCEQTEPMKKTSIPKHIRSNTHNERAGMYICTYCGKDSSRSDSLTRHLKSCSKKVASVPQGPEDIEPASSVPQPPMPQAPFTFQNVWDPYSDSATPASSESLDD